MTQNVMQFTKNQPGYDNSTPASSNNPYPVADMAYGPQIVSLLWRQNEILETLLQEIQSLSLAVQSLNQPTVDEPLIT